MATLLIFSFLAGFITILAPCIWPLLPIVFSASSGGGKRKSLGITLGVMTSFTIFTLFISYIVKIFPIDPNSLRLVATVIIGLLGLSMLIPPWARRFEVFINNLLGPLQSRFKKEGSGFTAGFGDRFFFGFSLGALRGADFSDDRDFVRDTISQHQGRGHNLGLCFGFGDPACIFFLRLAPGCLRKCAQSINTRGSSSRVLALS